MIASLSRPPRRGVDAEALLASLAPVVAKPDTPQSRPEPKAEVKVESKPEPKAESTPVSEAPKPRKLKAKKPAVEKPGTKAVEEDEDGTDDEPQQKGTRASSAGNRAKLDVEINPGEGSTAIYVRVPRTTHLALKLLALQNQAVMDGPTELASIVRTAIDEYLAKQSRAARKAA